HLPETRGVKSVHSTPASRRWPGWPTAGPGMPSQRNLVRTAWTLAGTSPDGAKRARTGVLSMRIAYGADDENETTRAVVAYLTGQGHEVVGATGSDRWPDIGAAVGRAVAAGEVDYGVVMCWTGTGTAIAANKVPGVRAALAWEPWIARGARLWNDANVLAM